MERFERTAAEVLDIDCVESFKGGCLDAHPLTLACTRRRPSVTSRSRQQENSSVESAAAVVHLTLVAAHHRHQIQFRVNSNGKHSFGLLLGTGVVVTPEIHVDIVPAEFFDMGFALSVA